VSTAPVVLFSEKPMETEQRYPGLAAHLRACGPCGEDFQGLLAAICSEAD